MTTPRTNKTKPTHAHARLADLVSAPTPLATALTPVGGADPVPEVTAPPTPADGGPSVDMRRGVRPRAAQITQANAAATELRSATTYTEHLGARVPPAATIANSLQFAAAWSAKQRAAETWAAYTRKQARLSWVYALGQIEKLKPVVDSAAARDPAFVEELPSFYGVVTARSRSSKKGAATKRRQKATETTAPAPSAAAPSAATATPAESGGAKTIPT